MTSNWDALIGSATDYTGLSHLVTGLSVGTNYQFRVRAKNLLGWGPYSSVVTLTPTDKPA